MARADRLFRLAQLLRGRRTGTTAAALADTLGVSVRTVMRDLDALRDAHVPINAERGRGGGVVLDVSYHMPPVGFTAREALLLLVLGRQASQLRTMPFDATLDTALDKLRAALPAATQRQLSRLQACVAFVGVPTLPVDAQVRAAVERAFLDDAPLALTLEDKNGGRRQHHVRIASVVCDAKETLLNCIDVHGGKQRQLRLHHAVAASTELS